MNEIKLISSPINLNERINFFILEWRVGWVKWELMEWLIASFIEELHSSNYGVNSYRFWPQSTQSTNSHFTQLNSNEINKSNQANAAASLLFKERENEQAAGMKESFGFPEWNGAR